jgi:hypothetical protein
MGNYLKGSDHDLIALIVQNLSGEREENYERHQNSRSACRALPEYMYTYIPLLLACSGAHLVFIYFLYSFFKNLKLCLNNVCFV